MGDLRVRLLGGIAVDGVDASAVGARKQRRLLARLAIARGAPVSTDALVEELWDDDPPAKPRDQVAVLVSRLRTALGSETLARVADGYALQRPWLDLDVLAERALEAGRRATDGQWAAAGETARAALVLHSGPLAPELDDAPWMEAERAAATAAVARARLVLAEAELAVGDPRLAADLAAEAVAASSYDEAALRVQMRACAAAGRPALGLSAYAAMRARLADELGVDPAPETEHVYAALLGPADPVRRSEVLSDSTSEPLSGRQPELARIADAVAAAARGVASLVVIAGEAGIGKSRLAAAAAADASLLGVTVVRTSCDELGRVLPLQPILDGLTDALRLRTTEEAAELLAGDPSPLAPLLGTVDARAVPPAPDSGAGALLLQRAALALLERLAAGRGLLLVVDDVHLADDATIALLSGLPRRARGVVALATTRIGEGPAWPAAVVTELGPLDVEAVARVVGPERAAELHARSGGHPLLLSELVAAPDGEELPASLRASVAAACDRVGPAAATLRAASVLGPVVDLDLLAAVLDRSEVALLDDLEAAVRMRLLVERESGFAFRHGLVREALAADVGATRSLVLHRLAARALATRPAADPLVVADHARRAGESALAARHLTEAARVAASRNDHATAVALAQDALALQPIDVEAALLHARELIALGRYAEAAAAALPHVDGERASAFLHVRAMAAHYSREWQDARVLADDAAARATTPAERVLALGIAGHASHAAGDVAVAAERFAAAEQEGEVSRLVAGWSAMLCTHQGRTDEALALTEVDAEGYGVDVFALPLVHMARGLAFAASGRPGEALASFARQHEMVERVQLDRYAGRAQNCTAYVLRNLGRLTEADELNEAGGEAATAIGTDEARAHSALDLAEGRLLAGDIDGAVRLLEHGERFGTDAHRHGFQWRHLTRARWLRGRIAVAHGALDDAEELSRALIANAEPRGVRRYAAFGHALATVVRVTRGLDVDDAVVSHTAAELRLTCGMEAWWLLGALAGAMGSDALHAVARDQVGTLLASVPEDLRDEFARYAATRLESATI